MTAEILSDARIAEEGAIASMRPRPNDRGNARDRPAAGGHAWASMRPRPNDRGNNLEARLVEGL